MLMNQSTRTRGLSDLQRDILVDTYDRIERFKGRDDVHHRVYSDAWGLRWDFARPLSDNANWRASVSRALRRLELRGLLKRRNDVSGGVDSEGAAIPHRTTHVMLTAAGVELAQRLTKKAQ